MHADCRRHALQLSELPLAKGNQKKFKQAAAKASRTRGSFAQKHFRFTANRALAE